MTIDHNNFKGISLDLLDGRSDTRFESMCVYVLPRMIESYVALMKSFTR